MVKHAASELAMKELLVNRIIESTLRKLLSVVGDNDNVDNDDHSDNVLDTQMIMKSWTNYNQQNTNNDNDSKIAVSVSKWTASLKQKMQKQNFNGQTSIQFVKSLNKLFWITVSFDNHHL